MVPRKKIFDAVEMSRKLREATGRRLFAMSQKQRLEFLHRRLARWNAQHPKEMLEEISAR